MSEEQRETIKRLGVFKPKFIVKSTTPVKTGEKRGGILPEPSNLPHNIAPQKQPPQKQPPQKRGFFVKSITTPVKTEAGGLFPPMLNLPPNIAPDIIIPPQKISQPPLKIPPPSEPQLYEIEPPQKRLMFFGETATSPIKIGEQKMELLPNLSEDFPSPPNIFETQPPQFETQPPQFETQPPQFEIQNFPTQIKPPQKQPPLSKRPQKGFMVKSKSMNKPGQQIQGNIHLVPFKSMPSPQQPITLGEESTITQKSKRPKTKQKKVQTVEQQILQQQIPQQQIPQQRELNKIEKLFLKTYSETDKNVDQGIYYSHSSPLKIIFGDTTILTPIKGKQKFPRLCLPSNFALLENTIVVYMVPLASNNSFKPNELLWNSTGKEIKTKPTEDEILKEILRYNRYAAVIDTPNNNLYKRHVILGRGKLKRHQTPIIEKEPSMKILMLENDFLTPRKRHEPSVSETMEHDWYVDINQFTDPKNFFTGIHTGGFGHEDWSKNSYFGHLMGGLQKTPGKHKYNWIFVTSDPLNFYTGESLKPSIEHTVRFNKSKNKPYPSPISGVLSLGVMIITFWRRLLLDLRNGAIFLKSYIMAIKNVETSVYRLASKKSETQVSELVFASGFCTFDYNAIKNSGKNKVPMDLINNKSINFSDSMWYVGSIISHNEQQRQQQRENVLINLENQESNRMDISNENQTSPQQETNEFFLSEINDETSFELNPEALDQFFENEGPEWSKNLINDMSITYMKGVEELLES